MIIAYIKQERMKNILWDKIRKLEVNLFNNNYIINLFEFNDKTIIKLVKIIRRYKIDSVVFSKDIDKEFSNQVMNRLVDEGMIIDNLKGKKLMEYMGLEIIEYILKIQETEINREEIYFLLKKEEIESIIDTDYLTNYIKGFRLVNLVSNDIRQLKKIQDKILEKDNILISISNNKKKALKRAKYIININLNKKELEKYTINRYAIIINLRETVKYDEPSFGGININNIEIIVPEEYIEIHEEIGIKFDISSIYESIVFSMTNKINNTNNYKSIHDKIEKDGIKIKYLMGNNGIITDQELQKIHNINLDKKRKLV